MLLLIDAFSTKAGEPSTLEGRVKLAKLDFLLRYPHYMHAVLTRRKVPERQLDSLESEPAPLETRMMRYRYGPWDPSYYAILGALTGRGLIELMPSANSRAMGYRTTVRGRRLTAAFTADGGFDDLLERIRLLHRNLDLTGANLTKLVYELPEISGSRWRQTL